MIQGDSGEYEFLTEAVELSKDVEGLILEIGLRAGMGTQTLIDACVQYRPGSTVISIDPFGSILYEGREGQICRLDYTDDMGKQCVSDLSAYILGKNINWIPFKMTDERFFKTHSDGVELYDLDTKLETKYACVHLDGPHSIYHLNKEINWFNERMESGSVVCIDDVTIDFLDISPIQRLFSELCWEEIKMGLKKGLWRKK